MQAANLLASTRYPIIYEADQPTAVVVDIGSFRQIELILDNLLHLDSEPGDALIAAAASLWQRMIDDAKNSDDSADWLKELNEL